MTSNSLDIFNHSDYREYLKKWIEHSRRTSTGNLTKLATSIRVHTTFLSHVLSGKKNLSLEQATLISEELNHTKLEREYFFTLIEMEKAGSSKLKQHFLEKKADIESTRKKLSSRVGEHHELTDEQRAIFYSSWIYVAIFVTCAINDGQTIEEISSRFSIARNRTQEYLDFLTRAGICEFRNGKYSMGKSVVYVPNSSPFVIKHHTNWRMKAIQKMDNREDSEIFFTSPMSVAKADVAKIREVLAKAIQESLEICKESEAEEVVCLNIDLFTSR